MPALDVVETVVINATPAHVRSLVREFTQWEFWSPWLSSEPDCPLRYRSDGLGYAWDGSLIGSGKIDIRSETDTSIIYELEFLKPWKSRSETSFHFSPVGEGTEVVWKMRGKLPFFMFFMKNQMKALVGSDYRRGLAKLKDYAETGVVPSKNEFRGIGEGLVSPYIGLRECCNLSELNKKIPLQFKKLYEVAQEYDLSLTAPPLTMYHKLDIVKELTDYTAAVMVANLPAKVPTGIIQDTINAPTTYCVVHTGAYRHLGNAWSAGMTRQRNKLFQPSKRVAPFEWYRSDPTDTAEDMLITEVHFPATNRKTS
ncbi:MAG: SRPBCC family protein [Myxococcales bacterium]|nr:SRPBCC family protein [Myxococcales bacterium]